MALEFVIFDVNDKGEFIRTLPGKLIEANVLPVIHKNGVDMQANVGGLLEQRNSDPEVYLLVTDNQSNSQVAEQAGIHVVTLPGYAALVSCLADQMGIDYDNLFDRPHPGNAADYGLVKVAPSMALRHQIRDEEGGNTGKALARLNALQVAQMDALQHGDLVYTQTDIAFLTKKPDPLKTAAQLMCELSGIPHQMLDTISDYTPPFTTRKVLVPGVIDRTGEIPMFVALTQLPVTPAKMQVKGYDPHAPGFDMPLRNIYEHLFVPTEKMAGIVQSLE